MKEELMAMEKKNIITQIGFNLDVPINLAKNPVFHQRSKYIDIRLQS